MLVITVCVGSSCHLRGSYQVIERLEELIKLYQLENKVELKASFCMENCSSGITIRIGEGGPITVFDLTELKKLFVDQVLPQIGGR
ncbi:hypothetical protein BBF96_12385 [Anoxybacter fermentans]|uniref:NADH dehydrogenase n=1 Tax=Anoxybacter fermentans TaxID=1323375 RepID=A0A3Q9HRI4_9FIRM|nr:(2Fe-2S) ferredoxin domain-containing protein [Anoxybacter fermentans]AZR74125.1 hypothetical protein BBF96_12385 [Anoxybacter fermentans]